MAFVCGAAVVQAQPLPGPDSAGPHGGELQRRERNLENLRLLKLLELLDLSEDQSTEFMVVLSTHRKEMRKLRKETEQVVNDLRAKLRSGIADDDKIRPLIIKIDDLRVHHAEMVKEFHRRAGDILTLEQLGKLTVFEERFEREVLEMVRGFHRGNRLPKGSMRNKL